MMECGENVYAIEGDTLHVARAVGPGTADAACGAHLQHHVEVHHDPGGPEAVRRRLATRDRPLALCPACCR